MFCVNCGKEIPNGIKFCSYCGVAVSQSKLKSSKPESENLKGSNEPSLSNDMQKSIVQQTTFQQSSVSRQTDALIGSKKEVLDEGEKNKPLHILAIICLLLIIIALIGGIAIVVKLILEVGIF